VEVFSAGCALCHEGAIQTMDGRPVAFVRTAVKMPSLRVLSAPAVRRSRKMSSLRCNAERPSAPHCCANLSSAVPVGMGVTLIICSIHLDLLFLPLKNLIQSQHGPPHEQIGQVDVPQMKPGVWRYLARFMAECPPMLQSRQM
jgi:hypothetical protein